MKRLVLAFALALAVSLTLLVGAAGAHHRHHTFFVGCCVFISPGDPFVHHHFIHHGFIDPRFGPSVIGSSPVVVIQRQPVWVPGFWRWTGWQWMWMPGHWFVHGQKVLLRNPCD